MMKSAPIKLSLITSAILLSACSANEPKPQVNSVISPEEFETRHQELIEREKEVARREADLAEQKRQLTEGTSPQSNKVNQATEQPSTKMASTSAQAQPSGSNTPFNSEQPSDETLLPPSAKSGECYARAWVEPVYQDYTESVLVKEASERIEVVPAKFTTVSEQVQTKPASFRIKTIPAEYKTISEQKLITASERQWLTSLSPNSAPAGKHLLDTAKAHGIKLEEAQPGMCFHEHFHSAWYEETKESVLVKDAYDVIDIVPAEFRWVEKKVLVKEATNRIEKIPAQYEIQTEQVIDTPAHTVWKKGTGPIQKIDEATGEIMCLVEVPATFKTVSKRVLKAPATSKNIAIPAVYKTVRVKELVSEAREVKRRIPAVYKEVTIRKKAEEASFTWHDIGNKQLPSHSRTGNQICLVQKPAVYETIKKTLVLNDARTERIDLPAQYKTVQVDKQVEPEKEIRHVIPAEYKTLNLSKIDKEGYMEWRSILCETNMTTSRIKNIQTALLNRGHHPGPIDGIVGWRTMRAVNAFQAENSLPSDKYLNMETINALNIQ